MKTNTRSNPGRPTQRFRWLVPAASCAAMGTTLACSYYRAKPSQGFSAEVGTIIDSKCVSCHAGGQAQGNLGFIDDIDELVRYGFIVKGDAQNSRIYQKVTSPRSGAKMPFGGPYLKDTEVRILANWINSMPKSDIADDEEPTPTPTTSPSPGATPTPTPTPEPTDYCPTAIANVSFANDIVPILATPLSSSARANTKACVTCHATGTTEAADSGFEMSSNGTTVDYTKLTTGGIGGRTVVAGHPGSSWLYQKTRRTVTSPATGERMPLEGPVYLTTDQQAKLCNWILQGAPNN